MQEIYETIDILLDVYAYNHAWKIAEQHSDFPAQSRYLLEMLKERRELNVDFVFSHAAENQVILANYGVSIISNAYEEEQLANYIMDLEAKVKNGNIIDFVRSVSPILYRLFQRLAKREIPNLENYIHDAKNDQYDTWLFTKMKQSDYAIFHRYLEIRRDGKVTSKALAELLQYGQFPQEIKQLISELRNFEKSVRNPLAHLIKPFDEEELHRTTNFSSQAFLDKIIALATYAGIKYNKEKFYLDQVNDIIKSELKRNG
ncbi:LytR family transcriptional regulator [Streptococcus lutetiensis]|uniref:LytR family transcriptional regulator n=1 Tax=Streptococcus lutetiensis TaxID=150055 RepID=UPI001BDB2ED3|nr:LytR family transcriptional regulator [Streptococcus lutetiensis]MBT0908356.1 LytR family transcriptional regulator [Streptococcus lutetiensis]